MDVVDIKWWGRDWVDLARDRAWCRLLESGSEHSRLLEGEEFLE